MNRRVSKKLRKVASLYATDVRGLQYSGGTASYPVDSAVRLYRKFKRAYVRGLVVKV